jgi:hypothetical protein
MWWKEVNISREIASFLCRASLFYIEEGCSKFFLDVSLPGYMASHPRREYSSYSLLVGTSNLTRKRNSFVI